MALAGQGNLAEAGENGEAYEPRPRAKAALAVALALGRGFGASIVIRRRLDGKQQGGLLGGEALERRRHGGLVGVAAHDQRHIDRGDQTLFMVAASSIERVSTSTAS